MQKKSEIFMCIFIFYRMTYKRTFVNIIVEHYKGSIEALRDNSLSNDKAKG